MMGQVVYNAAMEELNRMFSRDLVRMILARIGEDIDRPGLVDTPDRVVRSWDELYAGYRIQPDSIFKVFDGEPCNEMVVVRDLEFWSTCEHHMLPFFGKAHIGYIPSENRVIGLSKIGRVLEMFSRRLQLQERMTRQIGECMVEHLKPKGVGVIVEGKHLCMICRGVQKQQSVMTTSYLNGEMDEAPVRAEFLSLALRGSL